MQFEGRRLVGHSGHIWFVLTPRGLFLAGTADVDPCPLEPDEAWAVADLTGGVGQSSAVRGEVIDALDRLRWKAQPSGVVGQVPPMPLDIVTHPGASAGSVGRPLLLLGKDGQILVWVAPLDRFCSIDRAQLEVLAQAAGSPLQPMALGADPLAPGVRILDSLIAAGLIDAQPVTGEWPELDGAVDLAAVVADDQGLSPSSQGDESETPLTALEPSAVAPPLPLVQEAGARIGSDDDAQVPPSDTPSGVPSPKRGLLPIVLRSRPVRRARRIVRRLQSKVQKTSGPEAPVHAVDVQAPAEADFLPRGTPRTDGTRAEQATEPDDLVSAAPETRESMAAAHEPASGLPAGKETVDGHDVTTEREVVEVDGPDQVEGVGQLGANPGGAGTVGDDRPGGDHAAEKGLPVPSVLIDAGQPASTVPRADLLGNPADAHLVPIWPVMCSGTADGGNADGGPLGLAMVVAALMGFDEGRLLDTYAPRPIRMDAESTLADVIADARPGVLLLSCYLWTIDQNLELAARVKAVSPGTVTVFGGPSAPKYELDARAFFEDNPQADIIIRGEGEATCFAALDRLGGDLGDLRPLTSVDGLTVRLEDRLVRTEDRPRLTDLNIIPSPYLTGLFDHLPPNPGFWAIESNRGCPYGCTFCDWGTATNSRIRKLDLDRVKQEFDWIARRGVKQIFMADANFGIFERDLEIASYACELRRTHGAPVSFVASNAKNTTKYTVPIVEMLAAGGLSTEATISFQSMDEETLQIVRRKNIKTQGFIDLAREAADRGLPVLADIMLGLPGMTLESFRRDLQSCVEQEVTARVYGTIILPNSPMNEPEYRATYEIESDRTGQLISTSSYTVEEREEMVRFQDFFRLAEHFGILRHVIRYAAHVLEEKEVEVLWQLYCLAQERPNDFPLVEFVTRYSRRYVTEPMSWSRFYAEVRAMLVEELGLPDDSALGTALRVQEAVMPSVGRELPERIELEHDYIAFYRSEIRPTDEGPHGRGLAEFPPGEMVVDDPRRVCATAFQELQDLHHTPDGLRDLMLEMRFWAGDGNWELSYPLARPLRLSYHFDTEPEPADELTRMAPG